MYNVIEVKYIMDFDRLSELFIKEITVEELENAVLEYFDENSEELKYDSNGKECTLLDEVNKGIRTKSKEALMGWVNLTDEQKKSIAIMKHVRETVRDAYSKKTLSYNLLPLAHSKSFLFAFDFAGYIDSIITEETCKVASEKQPQKLEDFEIAGLAAEISPYVGKAIEKLYAEIVADWEDYYKDPNFGGEDEEHSKNMIALVNKNVEGLREISTDTTRKVSDAFVASANEDYEMNSDEIMQYVLLESANFPFDKADIVNFMENSKYARAIFSEVPEEEFYELVSKPEQDVNEFRH